MLRTILIASLLLITPLARAAEPETQPAPLKVLVMPFTVLGGDAKQAWIGRAVQQNLQAELSHQADLEVIGTISLKDARVAVPATDTTALDDENAFALGKAAQADILIFGNCQVVGSTVRITGRVLDIGTREIIGFLRATGPQSQLLAMEDTLVSQTMKFLGYSPSQGDDQAEGPAVGQGPVLDQPEEFASTEPTGEILEPAYAYPPPSISYPYAYTPYYYYPYRPYRYIGFGWGRYCPRHHRHDCHHDHDRDRDRDHDGPPRDDRGRGPRIDDPASPTPRAPRLDVARMSKPPTTPRLPRALNGRSLVDASDRTRTRPVELRQESPTKVMPPHRPQAGTAKATPQPRTVEPKRPATSNPGREKTLARSDAPAPRPDRDRTAVKVAERSEAPRPETPRRESPVRTAPRNDPPPARSVERPAAPPRAVERPTPPVRSAEPSPTRSAPVRTVERPSNPAPARDTSSSSPDRSSGSRGGRR